MTLDTRIAHLAESQYGVFTRSQARDLDATDHMIEHRIATGRWVVRSREALMLAGTPRTFRRELMAASLSIDDAHVAQAAAVQLWKMRAPLPRDRVVVMVPRGSNHRLSFATVRETSTPIGGQGRVVDGIPVTSRERTICDVARMLGAQRLGWLVDQQLNDEHVAIEGLHDVFFSWARRGRPGVRKLRAVLDVRAPGCVVPESELEQQTLALIRAHGLPEPRLQVDLTFWEAFVGRVDFMFPNAKLIVEVDGRRFHGPETFEHDRRRDNAANLAGWRVLRFTWRMVTDTPEYVVDAIREALRLGSTGGTVPDMARVVPPVG